MSCAEFSLSIHNPSTKTWKVTLTRPYINFNQTCYMILQSFEDLTRLVSSSRSIWVFYMIDTDTGQYIDRINVTDKIDNEDKIRFFCIYCYGGTAFNVDRSLYISSNLSHIINVCYSIDSHSQMDQFINVKHISLWHKKQLDIFMKYKMCRKIYPLIYNNIPQDLIVLIMKEYL